MISVLVADDHAVVRRGLRQILAETEDIVVGAEAANGPELLSLARERRWDVIVLDLNLGAENGLELLEQLRREASPPPVIVLTVADEGQYAVRAIRAGAAGFLNKEAAPERLIDAVRKVARGGRYVTPSVAEQLAAYVSRESAAAPHDALSDRELQVLKLIASGKTVSEIARMLALSVKTVSTHRTRLLAKMQLKTNAQLTHYAIRAGLVA